MGEIVRYAANGGTSEGYLAGSGPGVIVIQEWWGLVPHIKTVTDRFAAAGFAALAPDLYHGVQTSEPDDAGRLLMSLAMDQAARDVSGAADYLVDEVGATGDAVAAVGFCAGGSLALWAGTLSARITTAVGFYPPIPWERMSPKWENYTGKAAMIHCSEQDGTSAAPGIQTARQAIEAAGGEVTLYDYPGTQHAFFNDDRPEVYHPNASVTAWARTLELLRARLG